MGIMIEERSRPSPSPHLDSFRCEFIQKKKERKRKKKKGKVEENSSVSLSARYHRAGGI
jgi:hypothetical protein